MKITFVKTVNLCLVLISFLLFVLPMQAMSLTDASGDEVFNVNNIRGREGTTVKVWVDACLTHLDRDRMPSFCGRPCSLELWCSFLVRNFLSGYYTREVTQVHFSSEVPHNFESSSTGLFNGGDVYLTDGGNTAVIVCRSLADVNVTQMRYHAMFIFNIPVDSMV